MKQDFVNSQALKIIKQRNISFVFGMGMLVANILLCFFILHKGERIILVPPEINKTFWISNKETSEEYLTEMSIFLSDLLLDQTAASAKVKRDIMLKYVTPEFYNDFYKQLLKQEEYIASNNLTTRFVLKEIIADSQANKVILTGEMRSFIAGEEVKKEISSYELLFEHRGFRYLLSGFTQLKRHGR